MARPGSKQVPASEALMTIIQGELEVLTPVHVGNGDDLSPGDVVIDGGDYYRVDIPKLVARFADDPKATEALEGKRFILREFLEEHGVPPTEIAKYSMPATSRKSPRYGQSVLTFARTGVAQVPYIPGSTLKGALISGMLWLVNDESRTYPEEAGKEPEWISPPFRKALERAKTSPGPANDSELIAEFLGRDPSSRITRTIGVPDLPADPRDLKLYTSVLFHASNSDGSGFHWGGYRHQAEQELFRAQPTFIEGLSPRTRIPVRLVFDDFLLGLGGTSGASVRFPPKALKEEWASPNFLLSGVLNLAYNTLWQEYNFFARAGNRQLADMTNRLFQRCQTLPESEVMLRLGWGINWHGVTGYLWDDPTAKALRIPKRDHAQFPFPKTRRIVLENDRPIGTPGWCMFRASGIKKVSREELAAPLA